MEVSVDEWLTGFSPLDGKPLDPVLISSQAQIKATVEQARTAQVAWETLPVQTRASMLAVAGRHLMSRADEISAILHRELGKPLTETYAVDLGSAPEVFRYYCKEAPRLLQSEPVRFNRVMFPAKRARVDRVPHGVVALLTPWNYPVSIPLHNLVPALVAGNAVILKPSEIAPRTGAILHQILAEALPPGLLGLVQGDRRAGESLIRTPVDHVVFVGGTAGGRGVAQAAADILVPVSLELGGKDAAIVLADADLDRAAHGIAWAGFVNAGQSCAGIERVYVVEAVAQAFLAKLVAVAEGLRTGDDAAHPGSSDLGPLSTPQQFEIVRSQIAEALASGAHVHCGGPAGIQGQFYPPTVLSGVDGSMRIMQEETFGPVVPVQIVPDEATALREANTGPYGLTGSVWTRNLAHGERLARQLQVGVASVNNHMFSGAAPQAPWAGRGYSGYGVQNSKLALLSLTRPRLVAVDAHRTPRELWWFPYDQALLDLGRGMLTTRAGWRVGPVRYLSAYARMLRGVALRLRGQHKR